MFTSRAEYRLLLREDNADIRLTEVGRELGLVDDERWQAFCEKRESIAKTTDYFAATWVQHKTPAAEAINELIERPLSREYSLMDLLRRPELSFKKLQDITELDLPQVSEQVAEQVEIQAKYAGYIERQQDEINKQMRHENTLLPKDFDFALVKGLSAEVVQKLNDSRPQSIGQASRISGVTPAAISLLLVYLKKNDLLFKNNDKDKISA